MNDHSFYLVSGAGDKWRRSKQRENSERDSFPRERRSSLRGGPPRPRSNVVGAASESEAGTEAQLDLLASVAAVHAIAHLCNKVLGKDLLNNSNQAAENS